MDTASSCCFLGAPVPVRGTTRTINTPQCCAIKPTDRKVTRRRALKTILWGVLAYNVPEGEKTARAEDDRGCKNCQGEGKVTCEMCSGTGFWRALAGSDSALRYKGVLCPGCEGEGIITCPVCLGTGEGNVRGLLRRRTVEPGKGRILQSG